MYEPNARTPLQTAVAIARVSAALDTLASVISGFALLAGARAFTFIALLGWREPVLGGAGLVLLAMVGWLRWRCGGVAAAVVEPRSGSRTHRACAAGTNGSTRAGRSRSRSRSAGAAMRSGGTQRSCPDALSVACYNRPSQCDAAARPRATAERACRRPAGP
jgi:hypothetical protein